MSNEHKTGQTRAAAPESNVICAAPFLNGGATELSQHLQTGKLKSVRVKRGESLHFDIQVSRDGFCGVGLHLSLSPWQGVNEIFLELSVYEHDAPTPVRSVTRTVKPQPGPYIDPFLFDPIPESRNVTYRLVLQVAPKMRKATVLCSAGVGSVTIAGRRRYNGLQPVAIPYYPLTIPANADLVRPGRRRVSVLIVTYNSEPYVTRCLDSVFAQDYPNIEVIVVDNNSQDRTAEIVTDAYPGVKLLALKENGGYCKANNLGLQESTGEWIYVLNPDTVVEPGTVTHLVRQISISQHVAVVGCRIDTGGSATRYASAFLVGRLIGSSEQCLNDGRRFMAAPCGTSFLIRKSVILELGQLFDEGLVSDWEDHDLGLRCWFRGYICLHTPYMGVQHVGSGSFGFRNRRREARIMRNTLLTYFKNYGVVSFSKAILRTLLGCRNPIRLVGVIWFVGSLWRYLPIRAKLQKNRRISDNDLKIITCGVRAIVENESSHLGC